MKLEIWNLKLFPSHITLNGQPTEVEQLLKNRDKSSGWERDWLDFLAEWYNDNDFIEVQTSGSTGSPKTIHLKKEFVAASALRTISFFNLREGDRALHCLPNRFIAGKLMVVRALLGKLDLYVVDPSTDFDILRHPELPARRSDGVSGSAAPFKFAAMVINQVEKCLEFGISNLEFLLIGGSAIPSTLEEKLQTVHTRCYSSYAMTETATHIALRQLNGEGKDEWYHCLDGVRVGLNGAGCIRIEMPGLENGFLQTNDLAELVDDHSFRILGRADNVIISGGIKFSPEQLEEKLEPFIVQPFMITSLPHETLGQQLILAVEETETPELSGELQSICRQQLNKYEQPRQICFVRELPRTPNGKINRAARLFR
ncbi:AMP-binding protein [Gaoshiqia sediminis]|uniref:AMP-binding protein n=1 Tax=Gaoshiqia sediminis TaxID=2986998 RepID=A0AA41Y3B0_9BACT|nr:AMP-binding protein [Gaoshiqia sediminis]MCW0482676.1 AMP-binding protein [Gaoshiqia sediminis]